MKFSLLAINYTPSQANLKKILAQNNEIAEKSSKLFWQTANCYLRMAFLSSSGCKYVDEIDPRLQGGSQGLY
jgi:hypothetical protein